LTITSFVLKRGHRNSISRSVRSNFTRGELTSKKSSKPKLLRALGTSTTGSFSFGFSIKNRDPSFLILESARFCNIHDKQEDTNYQQE
jgi:hypothetical protein